MEAESAITALGAALAEQLDPLLLLDTPTLLARRYAKYRAIGAYQEGQHQLIARTANNTSASFIPPFS